MNTEEFHRKLTAILSADVQGYSRLMGEDEDSTVRTLTACRACMTSLIQSHRGHVVDTPGDNLLARFDSVMDAVRCAVEIQEELRIMNAELAEDRRMQFRIGINLGDVIEDGDHIYGDGINVAARIEGLAEGGGICVSGTVYDSIRNKLSMSYEYLGEHNVKNIRNPVRVYRIKLDLEAANSKIKEKKAGGGKLRRAPLYVAVIIVLGVVANWYFFFHQAHVDSDLNEISKTIAVLPFTDLSPENNQEYFVDGLSEELLNCLSKINALRVTSRTSSFAFKDTEKTLREVAGVLGVDHILEGSVRKSGNDLRITAQLIRVKDDSNLWSKTYDRELKDIFDLQETIAAAVAKELKVKLGIDKNNRQLGGTDNAKAYEYYLTAKGLIGQGSSYDFTSVTLEEKFIDSAIEIDPGFALAWVRKAAIHNYYELIKPADLADAERVAALKAIHQAIDLEPDLALGHHYLGCIKTGSGDFIGGELSIRKALELCEPTSECSILAFYHFWPAGHLKRAHEIIEKTRLKDPLYPNTRQYYIASLAFLGETQKAEEEYARIRVLVGENQKDDMAITLVRLGTKEVLSSGDIVYSDKTFDAAKKNIDAPQEGRTELRRLYASDNANFYDFCFIAMWAAYFGDNEFAVNAISKAVKINASGMTILWWPVMKDVRRLPRFKELVEEIGLLGYWNEFGWPDLCHPTADGDFECN